MPTVLKPTVYLSLGSNLSKRTLWLTEAIRRLKTVFTDIVISQVYETSPVDFVPNRQQPNYYNLALRGIPTPKVADIETFHRFTKNVEIEVANYAVSLGNPLQIKEGKGPRYIDIDIIFFDNIKKNTPTITLPHAHYQERLFVLVPLLELNPALIDPVSKEPLAQIKTKLTHKDIFAGQEIKPVTKINLADI